MALAATVVLGACGTDEPSADDTITLTSSDAGGKQETGIALNTDSTGKALPDADIVDPSGATVKLRSLVGTPLVINTWYSTCEPCKKELPALGKVARERAGKVTFIGVDSLDDQATAAAFAKDHDAAYTQYTDPDGNVTSALRLATAPVTVFVDAAGTIVAMSGPLDEATLNSILDTKLLAGS